MDLRQYLFIEFRLAAQPPNVMGFEKVNDVTSSLSNGTAAPARA